MVFDLYEDGKNICMIFSIVGVMVFLLVVMVFGIIEELIEKYVYK